MYRRHPQTLLARRLVADGAIGRLTTVRAPLSVSVGTGDIRRSRAVGGGALLDPAATASVRSCCSPASRGGSTPKVVVGDPWICRDAGVELVRNGVAERQPADPEGSYGLTGAEADVYRIELDTASAVILGEREPGFGRDDAVGLARVLERVQRSAESAYR
jgi:D-xylose 1-dehydrogenase (NADP+, D-xylono-1,5-lactone-forming)